MDLSWPVDVDEYRHELRAWFTANLAGRSFPKRRRPDTIQPLLDWEKALYEAGLAVVHWPKEFGGQGVGPLHAAVFFEEYIRAGAPKRLNRQALLLAGPTLMKYGTPSQQEQWIRNIISCDDIWCQGFSEPDAGSPCHP